MKKNEKTEKSGYEIRKEAFGLCPDCGHVNEYGGEGNAPVCPMKDMVVRCLVCGELHVACPPCEERK